MSASGSQPTAYQQSTRNEQVTRLLAIRNQLRLNRKLEVLWVCSGCLVPNDSPHRDDCWGGKYVTQGRFTTPLTDSEHDALTSEARKLTERLHL